MEIVVKPSMWSEILSGKDVVIKGKGYTYEGENFLDEWHFSGGLDGNLRVIYNDHADGWVGTPREALDSE